MGLFMDLLLMLGGVAVFMFGMKQMSQGIEQSAGVGVRKLFKKINKNRMLDYGIGIGATAIVQSSSATSIMTVGLANANIVTVKQGSGIILGAKVGTTLTAFIFALGLLNKGGFSVSALFSSFAFIGVIIIFTTNRDSAKKLALFLIGFGMLFIGLEVMETAIGGKDSILSTELSKLFKYSIMQNPFLLVILGVLFTCIIQSSTAAVGIFLTFLSTGVINSIDQSFFLVMGANIGTCLDGFLASIGTNANGKRIAVFHVLTSTLGAAFFSIILIIFRKDTVHLFETLFQRPEWSLATFNLLYNTIYTLILLAFLNPLITLVGKIIKDKEPEKKQLRYVDLRLLATPPVAVEQTLKEVSNMALMAQENCKRAFDALLNGDLSESKKIASEEYEIDYTTRELASFLIKISALPIGFKTEKLIGGLHHVINDIERIGDHAVLFAKEANYMKQNEVSFLEQTREELNTIYDKIAILFTLCLKTFETRKTEKLKDISILHQEILDLITTVRDAHIKRLSSNLYSVEVSKSLYATFFSLQRISDHLVNMAFSIRSNTGSKSEVFGKMEKAK